LWLNHGDEPLREIYLIAPELIKLLGKLKTIGSEIRFTGVETHETDPIEWLSEHEGHNIVLIDEYGRKKTMLKTRNK